VKLLTEYLERAVQLENLAAGETDLQFQGQLLKQAAGYRKLAAKRAREGSRLQVHLKQSEGLCAAGRYFLPEPTLSDCGLVGMHHQELGNRV
jgi:hypothetical protein